MSNSVTVPDPAEDGVVPGRVCGTCAMCCKVFAIPELDKGVQQWCRHVLQGRGCAIHPTRPTVCRRFICHWLRNPHLGPEWQPNRAKFLIYTEPSGRMIVAPDAGAPSAWRREPYYAQFKRWATAGAASNHQILVFHNKRATAILPDRDVDLGIVEVGDEVIYRPVGQRIEVEHRKGAPAA